MRSCLVVRKAWLISAGRLYRSRPGPCMLTAPSPGLPQMPEREIRRLFEEYGEQAVVCEPVKGHGEG